jgi:CRP-like cAMP-binding protein
MKSIAEKLDFDIEDILIQEGEEVDGIYLVTSGMVRVFGRGMNSYDPDADNKDPNQQDENGNFTHYDSTYSKENKFSYVHSGGLIGEIGVMLQRESDLTAECETACSAYLIRAEHIQTALDKFINLKNCIWKSIGINVALNQSIAAELLEIGSTSEQRRQYLEPSYFKDMWSAEQFIFDDSSNAVILIFGKVRIEYTIPKGTKKKEKYQPKIIKAPALIKHEYDEKYNIIDQTFHPIVSKVTGLTPKLLIVPAEVADDADLGNAIMDRITNFGGKDSVMGRGTGPNRSSKVGAAPIRAPMVIPPQITEARSIVR